VPFVVIRETTIVTRRRDFVVSFASNGLGPVSILIVTPFLAHGLGVAGRGELAAATAPLSLGIALATLGMPEAVTYLYSRASPGRNLVRHAVLAAMACGVVFAGVVTTLSPRLAAEVPGLAQLIVIATWAVVPSLAVSVARGLAAGVQAWRLILGERLIAALVRVCGIIALFATDTLDTFSAAIVMGSAYFVGGFAYLPLALLPKSNTSASFRTTLSYGSRIWLGSVAGILLSRIDQMLMVPLSGTQELGIYAVAVNASEAILIFNFAIREVVFSRQSSNFNAASLARAARVSTVLTAAAGGAMALLNPWLIPFIFGTDFSPAVPIAGLGILAVILGNPGSIAGAGLSALGRPGLRSASLGVAAVANIVLIFILVPIIGAWGAMIATAIGNLVSSGMNIVFLHVLFKIDWRGFYGFRRGDARLAKFSDRPLDRSSPQ
jgi:O-antigen/teichoic acid export membrane protein